MGCLPSLLVKDSREEFDIKAFVLARDCVQLAQHYKLGKELGRGSFGNVVLGEDCLVPGRVVAIKRMQAGSPKEMRLAKQEVELMKELDHPNICKLLETYEDGRSMILVMECCGGGDLCELVEREGPLTERVAATIFWQVAGALKYAHGRGIAHRDLKPDNICFSSPSRQDYHVKIIDWGLGKSFQLARMQSRVGSGAYAAPEVMMKSLPAQREKRGGYTSACDLFSLGVMLYVMLFAKAPFWGSVQKQQEDKRLERYPVHGMWEVVSPQARNLLRSLIKAKPSERLAIEEVLAHPWLRVRAAGFDLDAARRVLSCIRQCYLEGCSLSKICAAAVARQLDHKGLQELDSVFRELDRSGEGKLGLSDVCLGFERAFAGQASAALRYSELRMIFQEFDLNGSGALDYTEFCAAALQGRLLKEPDLAHLAFKAFDANPESTRLTKEKFVGLLGRAHAGKLLQKDPKAVADSVFARFDRDGDGELNLEEFKEACQRGVRSDRGAPPM